MKFFLAVHGGAGVLERDKLPPAKRARVEEGIGRALQHGREILAAGGHALDAVEAAARELEDYPFFNAGHGSVLNHRGTVEMDAAIADGATRRFGATSLITRLRNPILLARKIMDHSVHRFIAGPAAEDFAVLHGLSLIDNSSLITEERKQQWLQALKEHAVKLDHSAAQKGTIGAVACDSQGRLAAATSTGGMTNKHAGRIGDTPIFGAGTFANGQCAISCTGVGERITDHMVGARIGSLMELRGMPLVTACRTVIEQEMPHDSAGLIAVDASGGHCFALNTRGMYRGFVTDRTAPTFAVFADEEI
jgi:beta-aspartyl-peptidase (threonine type)